MDEPSRRALLGGFGTGVVCLLAGCAGRAPIADTGEPANTPESTPAESPSPTGEQTPSQPDRPTLADRLPAPSAVGGLYTFGAFDWTRLRRADLARGTLRPGRFVPGALHDALDATERTLTLNTGSAAGGTLAGSYDEGVAAALQDAGYSLDNGRFHNNGLAVAIDTALVRWADAPDGGDAIINAVGSRLDGQGERYTDAVPALDPVLDAVGEAPARLARPLVVDSGPFSKSTFLATGIAPDETEGVRWVSAVGFDGPVPDAAREQFRARYAELDAVDAGGTTTNEGLLVVEVATTAELITSIQPL